MGATWTVAAADMRRDRLRLVGLTVLVALAGGVSIAAVLGAERSRSSLDRFIDETNVAEVAVFGEDPEQFAAVGDLPQVATVSRFTLLAVMPEQVADSEDVFLPMIRSHDGRVPYELNRVRVVEGELPAPGDVDRIALHEATAQFLRVEVGDPLPMVGFTPADIEQVFTDDGEGEASKGPRFTLEVAALIRDPLDVMARPDDIVITPLTTGVADRYVDEVGSLGEGAFVQLRPSHDVESFTAAVRGRGLELQVERWPGSGSVSDTGFGPTLDLIGDGLAAFGLVVAVAGLLVVGQAFVRGATGRRQDAETLGALGLGRSQRRFLAAAPAAFVALGGAVLTIPTAFVLSAAFPIGLARRAEPGPGLDPSPGILLGASVVGLVLLATALLSAKIAEGRTRAWSTRRVTLGIRAPGAVGRAMSSGQGSAVWSTRVAVLLGAAGVTAALVFASSLDHLLETPEHYGWSFDTAFSGERFDAPDVRGGIDPAADPAVAEADRAIFQIELDVDGSPMFGYAIGDGSGEVAPVVAEGRVPRAPDEVAVGREAMRRLGLSRGDRVEISSNVASARFEVVGQAIVPVSTDGGRVGDGITMSLPAAARLGIRGSNACEGETTCYVQTAVRWRDGADLSAARKRLLDEGTEFEEPTPPGEVERLDEVDSIPWVLAGLLGLLATAAMLHAIVVTVNRRRRDLAVLRVLGATPADARRGVISHAVVMAVASAILGAGAGVAMGRLLWRSVASSVGVVAAPAVPLFLVLGLPFVIVAFAGLASVLPARRAGQLRPARILRAE